MDSSYNRLIVINSAMEEVEKGIETGTWQCDFYTQDFPKENTDIRYWAVTAISGDRIIETGYELEFNSSKIDEYWFLINENQKVIYQIHEFNGSLNSPELSLMISYINILVEEYKKIVKSLPE